MLDEQTKTQLRKLKLQAIIDSAEALDKSSDALAMTKEEWLKVLVGSLYEEKMARSIENKIRSASLDDPTACIEDLCTDPSREIDVSTIADLATCNYIERGHNVIIVSAAGGGKSWLASALGMAACRKQIAVKYTYFRELADDLKIARQDARSHKLLIARLAKVPLLVVDDWLLGEVRKEDYDELFSVIDKRSRNRKSTILCAQYLVEGWPSIMAGYPCAESIVDRIKNRAYIINLQGQMSMRERYMDEEIKKHQEGVFSGLSEA